MFTGIARRGVAPLVAVALAFSLGSFVPPAQAADAPAASAADALPTTASADALPTVQIDGVVWKQVIVGNTVYVGGEFKTARPAGAAPGVNTVPRSNMLAYDIRTGVLIDSFAPSFNAKVSDLAVTPDGSKLIAVGSFTQVDGQTRNRAAVFNLPTATLSTTVVPDLNGVATSVAASNTAIYFGGWFSAINNDARNRIGAVSASNGSLLPFTVKVDNGQLNAIVVSPDGSQVVFGGNFTTVNGSGTPGYGLYRADAVTGAGLPLPVNTVFRDAGANAGVLRLASDATSFYGTGWVYGSGGNSEGMFQASWSDGSLVNLDDCHGDTYDVAPVGDVVYVASHKHYCGNSGGFPQNDPDKTWRFQHSTAWTKSTQGTNTADMYAYPDHPGTPRPGLLPFFPETAAGSYTGQYQATWTVTGNSDYVLYGGEFPKVNETNQQGLVRYAVRSLSSNKQGPRPLSGYDFTPTVKSLAPGQVRVQWPALWDRDDDTLTYQVYRNDTATLVHSATQKAMFWNAQPMSFTDKDLTPGSSVRYAVRVLDPGGNLMNSGWVTTTVSSTDALGAYGQAVEGDGAIKYWRLNEASGNAVADSAGSDDTTSGTGVTRKVAGALLNSTDTASTFNGTSSGVAVSKQLITGPNTLSQEVWFKTTTRSGGKIAGFGDKASGSSSQYDRHLYMDTSGRIYFGVSGVTSKTTVNSTTGLNDGKWHQAVGTLSSTGMALYIDGKSVATKAVDKVKGFSGYWRVGGDSTWSGATYFNGSIDEYSVYPTALTPRQVDEHWVASGRASVLPNVKPTAAFTSTAVNLKASFDGSGSTDSDGTVASYDWVFGDGTTGTGVKPDHTYPAAGSYSVKLTVTDDRGAVSTAVTKTVTVTAPPPNVKPTAVFTSETAGFKASFDASGSTDSDGTVATYAWDFGDGGSGTGATATHTYGAAGSFAVKLTVTDNDGGSTSLTKNLVVTAPPPDTLASDAFQRTTTSGWGDADMGGTWTIGGEASRASVSGGAGQFLMPAGLTESADLNGVSSSSSRVTTEFSVDKLYQGTSEGSYVAAVGRQVGADSYKGRLVLQPDGSVRMYLLRNWDALVASYVVPNLTIVPGQHYKLSVQVTGTSPTTVSAKVWKATDAEPAGWQRTATDSFAALQGKGSVGVFVYMPGNATNVPITTSFHSVVVKDPTASVTNAKPTAAFTSSVAGLKASVDASSSADSDGTVDAYAWQFGDGESATGATATHTYAAAGTYAVKLTVTDNDGASTSVTRDVTVTAPASGVLASDSFIGSATGGWGSADVGGAWTIGGNAARASVTSGTGQFLMPAGLTETADLRSVSTSKARITTEFSVDKLYQGTSEGAYVALVGRQVGNDAYTARLVLQPNGAVRMYLLRNWDALVASYVVPNLTIVPGQHYKLSMQATGTSPTTVSAKVWKATDAEPAAWQRTATDSFAALQTAGSLGLFFYLPGNATNAPLTASFHSFLATSD